MDTFCETDGNVVDTADLYSAWIEGNKGGESEEAFGAYLAAREGAVDDLVIALIASATTVEQLPELMAGTLPEAQCGADNPT